MSKFVELSRATADDQGTLTLTGITSDYPVAIVYFTDVVPIDNNADLQYRFRESSGSDNNNTNYNVVQSNLRTDRSSITAQYDQLGLSDRDRAFLSGSITNDANKGMMGYIKIYNASNSSEPTHGLSKSSFMSDGSGINLSQVEGTILREASTVTGVTFFFDSPSCNIESGDFILYGLKN